MSDYYVIKKEQMRKQCLACNGSGVKRSQMQGHKFVKPCVVCGGLGINVTFRTTEVLLSDALKALAVFGERKPEAGGRKPEDTSQTPKLPIESKAEFIRLGNVEQSAEGEAQGAKEGENRKSKIVINKS